MTSRLVWDPSMNSEFPRKSTFEISKKLVPFIRACYACYITTQDESCYYSNNKRSLNSYRSQKALVVHVSLRISGSLFVTKMFLLQIAVFLL